MNEQPDLGFTISQPASKQQPDLAIGRSVQATAYGIPKPQGSMSAQVIRKGPRAGQVAVYHQNEQALMPWRVALVYALRGAHDGDPMQGPVGVHVVFTMPKPKSAPKRRHVWPAKKPDLDKLLRGVLDAATYAGVWVDDSQVVMATCSKHYVSDGYAHVMASPGAYVHVWEVR
jgi:Holliday junction resolvase RusA-like endonuclease